MMVMTAKVDKKKIALILTAVAVVVVALVLFLRSGNSSAPTAAPSVATNDGRVKFLTSFGWDGSPRSPRRYLSATTLCKRARATI